MVIIFIEEEEEVAGRTVVVAGFFIACGTCGHFGNVLVRPRVVSAEAGSLYH